MKKVRKIILIFLGVTALVLLMSAGAYEYLKTTRFELFGHPCDIYMENISFEGSEISDVISLETGLTKFKSLKGVDLGSYKMHVEDEPSLINAFPNVNFHYDKYVNIEGVDYPIDATEVSLSDHGYQDLDTLITKLSYMPDVKTVTFGENHITHEDKILLGGEFPGVNFEVVEIYKICGKDIAADVTYIDISDCVLDANILDELALFKKLEQVDLHNQPLAWEDRVAFAVAYPMVKFGWVVDYGDKEYDSTTTTEIDLSRKRLYEKDLQTLKELTWQIRGLEKLIVCDCGLSNETLGEFRKEIPAVNLVWRLSMGKWRLRTDQVTFSVLIYKYDYERLRSKDIQVLKYCTDLKCLDLGHQSIVDISVIGEYLSDLRLLIMADNWINDLAPLSKCKHLHYLELFVNNITDISPLGELHELVDVNISYNRRLSDITPLLNSPMMERVWLESTSVSAESFDLLEATYPNAKVVRVVKGRPSVDQGWRDGCARYQQMMDMWFNNYYGDEFSKYDDLAIELGLRDDEINSIPSDNNAGDPAEIAVSAEEILNNPDSGTEPADDNQAEDDDGSL